VSNLTRTKCHLLVAIRSKQTKIFCGALSRRLSPLQTSGIRTPRCTNRLYDHVNVGVMGAYHHVCAHQNRRTVRADATWFFFFFLAPSIFSSRGRNFLPIHVGGPTIVVMKAMRSFFVLAGCLRSRCVFASRNRFFRLISPSSRESFHLIPKYHIPYQFHISHP
jgi:hypothetical protein